MLNLLQDKGIRRYLLAFLLVGSAGAGACLLLDPGAGAAAVLCLLLLLGITVGSIRRRSRQISLLSDQMAKISGGDFSVDLREYANGELSILKDELYKMTRALSHQAQTLAKDKTYLADALSDISHQLKTPLTSMAVMAELLGDPALPPAKEREFLAGIRQGCQRLQWLVTALLKMSRLDAQAVRFRREACPVSRLVEQAAAPLLVPIELKGQRLELELEPGIQVEADPEWMTEALGNLIKNSVEHTPRGGVIRVSCRQNPLYTDLVVEDSGPGIPPRDLPHLFERFYRGENAAPDSVGIGLAMSRTIVRRQGGELCGENRPEGGARFRVRLYRN